MKSLLRNTALYGIGLFLLPDVITGVRITGGLMTYIIGGLLLTLMMFLVRPVIRVITFPLHIITLGFFSIFTNVIILYFLTVLMPAITIHKFVFQKIAFAGFIIPSMTFSTFLAYVAAAFVLFSVVSFTTWLMK